MGCIYRDYGRNVASVGDPTAILNAAVPFLIVLLVLVMVHELGHFVTAKLAKVTVQEFGFGYPPRLFRY